MGRRLSTFAGAALLLWLVSGCSSMIDGRPPGPWYDAYQPIEDPASEQFIDRALEMAVAEFGDPAIPVGQIILRRSRKTEAAGRYRIGQDFSLTECIDSTNGVFVVYIGVDPGHPNYYALLGHECCHLVNAHITDWYMEGIATVFSEEVCAAQGLDWGDWKRHFMRSRREPYALSYRMMRALKQAYPAHYSSFLRHVAPNEKGAPWQRIDIDSWLDALPAGGRDVALGIIAPYVSALRNQTAAQYTFAVPNQLD
ncbi:hypothetical protein [Pontiella sp.]|uniref:hypothetical protein n=1 Tax=Pontiella sp. TaxID=2837462 RepID=UPI00356A6367